MIIDVATDNTFKDIKNAIDDSRSAIVGAITDSYDEDTTLTEVKDLRTIDGVTQSSAGGAIRSKFSKVDASLANKANIEDLVNGITFKGSDTTVNIKAKTDMVNGDKWYSTDENVYYMYSSSGWINCGSGENLALIENEIGELKETLFKFEDEISDVYDEEKTVTFDQMGYIDKNGQVHNNASDSGYAHAFYAVNSSEKYTIKNSVVYSSWCKYCIYDNSMNVIDAIAITNDDVRITVPTNGAFIGLNREGFISLVQIKRKVKESIEQLQNPLKGLKLVVAGDSISAGESTEYEYGILAKDYYGIEYLNTAKSGRTMADVKVNGVTRNGFAVDRYKLVPDDTDILTIWFGYNDQAYGWASTRDNYCIETYGVLYKDLSQEQKTEVDAYKTQDKWEEAFIGIITDTDTSTWCGAWNFVLDYFVIQKSIERVGVILPYGVDEKYTNQLIFLCERFGVPYINAEDVNDIPSVGYSKYPFSKSGYYRGLYTYDGLHPNEKGYDRIARGYIPWIARI